VTNWTWVVGRSDGNSLITDPIWASEGLQPGDGNTTLPEVLRDHGYLTAQVGKAHFGAETTPGADPTTLGFDINIGGSSAGGVPTYFPDYGGAARVPGLEAHVAAGAYLHDALTLEAKKVIDQAIASERPFFLNMAHYAVHAPLEGQGPPALLGAYAALPTPEDDYAAMLESADSSLGALLDHLDARGVADQTLVVFVSDNGGLSRFYRFDSSDPADPWHVNEHNRPLASGKGSALEGGIRVPVVFAWAGQDPSGPPVQPTLPIPPGSVRADPVHSDDVFETLLRAAEVPNPASYLQETDGVDLGPLLADGAFDRGEPLYFHYPHQWVGDLGIGPGIEPFTAVRDGAWKLIYYWSTQSWALYDLADDLGETTDLSLQETGVVYALGNQMIAWLVAVGAQLPRDAATLATVPLPQLPAPACSDGFDNDGDGLVDFDGGQSVHGTCSETCPPGVSDPDADGQADPDPDCIDTPGAVTELPEPSGALMLGSGVAFLLAIGRRRIRPS
jgi:arylsulfatase A-like enzyme